MANEANGSWLDGAAGLWPGVAAGAVCGLCAIGQGPMVAAAVAGLATIPLGIASVGATSLRRDGSTGSGWIVPATAVVLAAPALSVLGSLLKANTHHRALAGVTFAIVGLGVVAGALAVGGRVRQLAAGRRSVAVIAAALAAGIIAFLAWRLGGGRMLDAALVPLALVGGWLVPTTRRALGAAGLAAFVALGALGALVAPGQAARVHERTLLLGAIVPAGPELAPAEHGH